jgi:hypothetical protein
MVASCTREAGGSADTVRSDARPSTRSSASTSLATSTWTITESGWGPIRAGMSVADVRVALGGQLPEPVNRECDHLRPPMAPAGLLIMTVGDQVARVEMSDTTVATAAGVRVGDSEARAKALYPGRVQTTPHKYVDGHYLVVRRGAGADSGYRLVFETDGRRVTRYRGGRMPEVEWVEGCG